MPTATVDWPVSAPATPVEKQGAARGIWIGAVAVLLLGGIALASSLAFSRRRADPATPVTSAPAVAIASRSAAPPADTAPAQDPTAEAPTPAPASRARPNRGSRAAVAPPPQPPPASTCNPPFTIDSNGVKRFKPDCF